VKKKIIFVISIILFLGIIISYVLRVCPSVLGYLDDSPSLVVAAATYGIPHGFYPLFILLGFGFSKIPLGEVAFRLNFAASLAATLMSVLLFYTLNYFLSSWKHVTDRAKLIAVVTTTLIFAVFGEIRMQAEDFEVHIFHAFFVGLFVASLIYLEREKTKKALYFIALSLGLLLAINPTSFIIFILPFGVYMASLIRRCGFPIRDYIVAFLIFCLPLLSFIPYLYQLMNAEFNYVNTLAPVMTPWFWEKYDFSSVVWRSVWHFGGWERLELFKEDFPSIFNEFIVFVVRPFFLQVGSLGLILSVIGFIESLRVNKRLTLTLFLAFVIWLFFVFSLKVDFTEDKILPVWFVVYIWLGVGIMRWFSIFWDKKLLDKDKMLKLPYLAISILPIFFIFNSVYNKGPRNDAVDCYNSEGVVYQQIMSYPKDSVLATAWGSPVNYYLIVEKVRTDVRVFPGYAHSPTRKEELRLKYGDKLVVEDTWQMKGW